MALEVGREAAQSAPEAKAISVLGGAAMSLHGIVNLTATWPLNVGSCRDPDPAPLATGHRSARHERGLCSVFRQNIK
jgi:hypothetical protein